MRSSRAATVVPALLLTAGLAACSSSSTSGHGGSATSGAAGGSSGAASTTPSSAAAGSSSASTPAGAGGSSSAATSATTTAAQPGGAGGPVFAKLQAANAKIHSVHVTLTTAASGVNVTASGDETLNAGKLSGFDLRENVSTQSLRIIYAGGKTYVQLPAALRKSTKPYSLVSANSTNPAIQAFAKTLGATLSSSSLSSYAALVQAASSVRSRGQASVAGQSVTHYSIVIDVSKLPASLPNRAALQSSDLKTVPLEMYLDSQNRPVEITEQFAVSGQHIAVRVLATRYNQPVHIVAPPASQVDPTK